MPIPKGQRVIRYGQTIGFATIDIEPGDWVHTHNLTAGEFSRDYAIRHRDSARSPRRSRAARSRATAGPTAGSARATTWP